MDTILHLGALTRAILLLTGLVDGVRIKDTSAAVATAIPWLTDRIVGAFEIRDTRALPQCSTGITSTNALFHHLMAR